YALAIFLPSLPLLLFFFLCSVDPRDLHSFPTRRSSDLYIVTGSIFNCSLILSSSSETRGTRSLYSRGAGKSLSSNCGHTLTTFIDRKSTRLNSSHVKISYAVFCLKKKKIITT